ncbi:unnamed protein product [Oppiella nova]|uniref:Uncharacterized protein n=1 Tax=Oppiella nova TaxID=334625 RepID=A0A7R9QNL1_9ACAR|nr:unnamed protein product [Oppiella nova]CAG2169695.1 unnamed protein product [Oppiella nova]
MAKHAVLRNGHKYGVSGLKNMKSAEVDHLRLRLLNGVEVSERALLLNYGNQRINGLKVVNNHLTVNSEINSNTVNDINIGNLSQSLVLKGYNNSINSLKTFTSLTVNNVMAFGRVDGVDLNELHYFIGLPIDLQDLRVRLQNEDQKIESLERALDQQTFELAFYSLYASIPSGPALLSYHNSITASQHLFISGQHLTNGCQEIGQNQYIQRAVIHTQSVSDIKVVADNNPEPCLVMAIPVVNGVFGQSIVVCLNRNANFYLRETIPLLGRDQFTIMRSTSFNRTLMASIKSWSPKDWMSDITISDWSSRLSHFDHSIQTIQILNPFAIHFVDIPSDSMAFLFASEKKTSLTHSPVVRIFRYNHKRVGPLLEVQQIKDMEVIQIESARQAFKE